jgi:tetratricopeptide (TPR) repeat protein
MAAQTKPDALVLYRQGDYAQAVKICEQEIIDMPRNLDSYSVLCWSLIGNRQYSEAEQRAQEGLKVNAYDIRLIEVLGEAKYYLGKNAAALEQFEKYIDNAPDDASRIGTCYYYMGEIYIRQGRYQHADIAFTAAVKKEPLLDRWWARLGYAREMAHNYYESMAAYEESLKLNPSGVDARRGKDRVSTRLQ